MTIRAAVVGCGSQGRIHLESLQRLPGVEVVAICDNDSERLAEVGNQFAVAGQYQDWRRLLEAHQLDLLTVCTMPNTHHDICVAGVEVSANVLCEKPFAIDSAEAASMVRAAQRAGSRLTVGFNMRFLSSATAVRQFLESGQLGRPVCAHGFMLADDVPWWGPHYIKEVSGGGALAATAVHMLDLVRWLVGNPLPVTATASMTTVFPRKRGVGAPGPEAVRRYSTEDIVFGHVRFDNGFWMSVEGSWMWDKPGWNYSFDLVGDRGQAHLFPLELLAEEQGEVVDVTGDHPSILDMVASVGREIEDVVAAIQSDRDPIYTASAREALVTQALVDALYRSAASGHEVEVVVPEVNETAAPGPLLS